jgi:glyceraldehyde 3-phosphate dehydrogenase
MTTKVAINGFGRIGRRFLRRVVRGDTGIDVVAINSNRLDPELAAHLLKYDSVFGRFPGKVSSTDEHLIVNGRHIRVLSEATPAGCPWGDLGVDVVVEATGVFTKAEAAHQHLDSGARKVVITAPAKGADNTIIMGVNEDTYRHETDHVVSASSCTTNCLCPLLLVLDHEFGVKSGLLTTIHAFTRDQELLDGTHPDPRRARAATLNMCPTTTGSAQAVDGIFPHLAGRVVGIAVRIPLPDVSLVDLSLVLNDKASISEVNAAFERSAGGKLAGILDVTDEPLVSSDFHGDEHSAVVDMASTRRTPDGAIKVLAWYDNEAGYAARVVELVRHVGVGLTPTRPVSKAQGTKSKASPGPAAKLPVG